MPTSTKITEESFDAKKWSKSNEDLAKKSFERWRSENPTQEAAPTNASKESEEAKEEGK